MRRRFKEEGFELEEYPAMTAFNAYFQMFMICIFEDNVCRGNYTEIMTPDEKNKIAPPESLNAIAKNLDKKTDRKVNESNFSWELSRYFFDSLVEEDVEKLRSSLIFLIRMQVYNMNDFSFQTIEGLNNMNDEDFKKEIYQKIKFSEMNSWIEDLARATEQFQLVLQSVPQSLIKEVVYEFDKEVERKITARNLARELTQYIFKGVMEKNPEKIRNFIVYSLILGLVETDDLELFDSLEEVKNADPELIIRKMDSFNSPKTKKEDIVAEGAIKIQTQVMILFPFENLASVAKDLGEVTGRNVTTENLSEHFAEHSINTLTEYRSDSEEINLFLRNFFLRLIPTEFNRSISSDDLPSSFTEKINEEEREVLIKDLKEILDNYIDENYYKNTLPR